MLRRVALVGIDVPEERSAPIIRVTRIVEPGTSLAVTINRQTLRRNTMWVTRRNIPEDGILHSHLRENLKSCLCKYRLKIFFIPLHILQKSPKSEYFNFIKSRRASSLHTRGNLITLKEIQALQELNFLQNSWFYRNATMTNTQTEIL
jgi:hypothetical protein